LHRTGQVWLGNLSTFTNSTAGHMIYEALGVSEAMTFTQIGGHNHCQFPSSQAPWVTSYVKQYLLNQTGESWKIETDGNLTFDKTKWVDWTTPTLQ
jgi:hypothetical protein